VTDDISDIQTFYDEGVDAEESRLEVQQLEYDLTWRYLTRYMPPTGSVLEVGAATGRYTLDLCRRGYAVTAVDLSSALLERCRERLETEGMLGQARLVTADARDLAAVGDQMFDAVLLMGPLYHLVMEEDRHTALQEAVSRLRPGGILFSAFLSRFGIFGDLLKRMPDWIEKRDEVASFLAVGRRPDDAPKGGFRSYFARVSEIAPLHEAHGLETVALAGIEPAISADDESYNSLEGSMRESWLDLLFSVSTEASTIGASRHLLYVGHKGVDSADGGS